ncbi:hypothetical protein ACFVU4_24000 [Streptomyces sp. NPDC058107]|uniref:hypothetical protein n=1 Tax=Streptomyces sp. NPDC058107 TaxID=3346343 RepID=UPI0036E65DB2
MGDPLTPINAAAPSGGRGRSWEGAEILVELLATRAAPGETPAGEARRLDTVRDVASRDDLELDLPPYGAGSGLGLSIVRSVVVGARRHGHGGVLPEGGLAVTVRLPVDLPGQPLSAAVSRAASQAGSAARISW